MSTSFWNVLKLSPALLAASWLVAGSAQAAENVSKPITEVNNSQASATVKPIVAASTGLPNLQGEKPSVSQLTASNISTSLKPADSPIAQQVSAAGETVVSQSTPANARLTNLATSPIAQQVPAAGETVVSKSTPTNASPSNPATSTIAQQVPANNTGTNTTGVLDQIEQYNNEGNGEVQDQVTNVTQLTDVRPTDWAYEALRSLVERYGCIVGYPDRTFRGNRALSRYEFAAGLNACLNQVERLIASSTSDFVRKSDLETLQRLVNEFRTELTALGARVDKLEGRVGFLEDHQFSTTTKLNGEVIFAVSDLFGNRAGSRLGNPKYGDQETVFQDRVRLNFDTSFTGKDRLRTRLAAGNETEFGPLRNNAAGNPPGTNITREGRFGYQFDTNNSVVIDKLWYRVPINNIATVHLFAAGGAYDDYVALLNPNFDPSGTGALSRFGRYNPIYRTGGQGSGLGLTLLGGKSPVRIDLGYMATTAFNPNIGDSTPVIGTANNPGQDSGIFNGDFSALGQVTFQPSKAFSIAATYVQSYGRRVIDSATGSIPSEVRVGRPIVGNSYGVEASFAFTPQLVLSGWAGYTRSIVLGVGKADTWNYAATLAINDLGTKGSTLGFVVGMEPKLTGSDAAVGLLNGGIRRDRDTGLHVEGFYKFKLTNNILITPGVIWLTSPGHDDRNDDIVIGTIRTTFSF